SPSSRRPPAKTPAPPSAPSPRSTTTCACSLPASAIRTAPTAARRSPPRPSPRWWTSSWRSRSTKLTLLAPMIRGRKGEYKKELQQLRKEGFTRVVIDGKPLELAEEIELDKKKKH